MVSNFWERVDAILKDVPVTKQLFDAKVLIERLSSFIFPKIMIVQHVWSG